MFYTKMSDARGAFLALVILFPFREKKANFPLCPKYRETWKVTRFFHLADTRPPHDERSLLHMCRCDHCNLPNYPFLTLPFFIPIQLFPPAGGFFLPSSHKSSRAPPLFSRGREGRETEAGIVSAAPQAVKLVEGGLSSLCFELQQPNH